MTAGDSQVESMRAVAVAACLLFLASSVHAYSFPSCVDYDRAQDICYGFPRDYEYILPLMSHAYNYQQRAYNFTNSAVRANNTASRANPAVDPTVQNRTSARAAIPNNQQVFNAYGRYPMLVAAPGQAITMTWPRTAPPDGTAADGSEFLNVYYNPNATINAGTNYNRSTDPALSVFEQHHLANLSYANGGDCAVDDNKYDLSVHCSGQVPIPSNLTDGIYTFLWHWVINNTSPSPVDGVPLYLEYRFAFEVRIRTALAGLGAAAAAPAPAPAMAPAEAASAAPSLESGVNTSG